MHVTKSDLFGAWAKEVNRKIPTDLGFLFVCTEWLRISLLLSKLAGQTLVWILSLYEA